METTQAPHESYRSLLLSIVIGVCGGYVALLLHVPLPWLLGSLVANATYVLLFASLGSLKVNFETNLKDKLKGKLKGKLKAGFKVRPVVNLFALTAMPSKARVVLMAAVGGMLGRGFQPGTFKHIDQWFVTILIVIVFAVLILVLLYKFYRRFARFDVISALLAGMPGGLSEMVVLAEQCKAKTRAIILIHAIRIAFILITIPALVVLLGEHQADLTLTETIWTPQDWLVILSCMLAGGLIGRVSRMPAGGLTGPMVLSAIAHNLEIIHSAPPAQALIIVQVLMGANMGCRFINYNAREVLPLAWRATLMAFAIIVLTCVVAWVASEITGRSIATLLLAFVPGGFGEMALIAFSLGIDSGFVTSHHAVRIFLTIILAPPLIQMWERRHRH